VVQRHQCAAAGVLFVCVSEALLEIGLGEDDGGFIDTKLAGNLAVREVPGRRRFVGQVCEKPCWCGAETECGGLRRGVEAPA